MLFKTSMGLVFMASAVSATFFPIMPMCWRKCAREAGVMCQWGDLPCLCKAANNGLMAKSNACACNTCDDWEFGNDDKAKLDQKEFSYACKVVMTPLDGAVSDAAYHSATCPGTASPQPQPQPQPPSPPPVAPVPKPPIASSPPALIPPPYAPSPQPSGWLPPSSLSPAYSVASSPVLSSATIIAPSASSFSPSTTLTVAMPPTSKNKPIPTSKNSGPKQPYASSPLISLPAAASITVSSSQPFAPKPTSGTSKPVVGIVPVPIAGAGYDSTQVISQTIMISPAPLNGAASTASSAAHAAATSAAASASKAANATKTGNKPAQFAGSAARPDLQWGPSIFALIAAFAYGIV